LISPVRLAFSRSIFCKDSKESVYTANRSLSSAVSYRSILRASSFRKSIMLPLRASSYPCPL
jgi:hypothetical protein